MIKKKIAAGPGLLRVIVVLAISACAAFAQLTSVPNTDFPTFRTNLNASLANGASITGNYANPSWIASLAAAKITGLSFQTVAVGGTAQTQQPTLNFINGTNVTISCVNNSGGSRLDCTFNATARGGRHAT